MTILDLTTTARVAQRLKAGATSVGTSEDSFIGTLITSVSAQIEQYLGRTMYAGSVTEYLDVEPGQRVWRLAAYPVTAWTSANFDPAQTWGSDTALTTTDDLYSPVYDESSLLRARSGASFMNQYSTVQPASLKVVYTGGMASSAAALIAAYPDIALACDMQVCHQYKRKDAIGTSSVGGPTSLAINAVGLLPEVTAILDAYINPAEL